jgi:transposase InsO family protein
LVLATAVIDCFCPTILGWAYRRRFRTKDVFQAVTQAPVTSWPYGVEAPGVTLRHDSSSQFIPTSFLEGALGLGATPARTAYRHPDTNAFVERLLRTYKEEWPWPNEFTCYEEALAAAAAWVDDYNFSRLHDSLGHDTTPAEFRARALEPNKTAA